MKKRVFMEMDDAVFRVVIHTEDWSQGDVELMAQFGEPEVDVGGDVSYQSTFDGEVCTKTFGHEYVRILHGFPYGRGFDSRDYGADSHTEEERCAEATAVGEAWKKKVLMLVDSKITELRSMVAPLPTEEVSEI